MVDITVKRNVCIQNIWQICECGLLFSSAFLLY